MAFSWLLPFTCFLNIALIVASTELNLHNDQFDTYIVHVEPQSEYDPKIWHNSFFPTLASTEPPPRMLYHYRHVLSGFAAKLSSNHLKSMQAKDGFVAAFRQRVIPLQTTHSPQFLGLSQNFARSYNISNHGRGVIIGVLDTGISPDHPSFDDEYMPPPPSKWRGKCEFNSTSCNNKIIGARFFENGDGTPLDQDGHGTHTSSTAAGVFVEHASIYGNANGTAVGMAPLAHLASYKVCGSAGCTESSILAAMDLAIEDGVDILSLSLAGESLPFYEDSIALGAYSATEKGILVTCSAGNFGPSNSTMANEAPWIMTVGASSIDRRIVATLVLGNGQELEGETAFQPKDFPSKMLPLVYPGANATDPMARFCNASTLNTIDVKGKIVLCEVGGTTSRTAKGVAVKNAGGAAMVLMNQESRGYTIFAEVHVLPAVHVSYSDGLDIIAYLNSTVSPMSTIIYKGTRIGGNDAPAVTGFSSRGPSLASPGILKPDIIGPGLNILAAWPFSVLNNTGTTKATFNMISGTSMSCPHLSGVAALLKGAHPDWSPAAVKSAIMTTAYQENRAGDPIKDHTLLPADVFSIGAGHVDPARASDPGLVYDIWPGEYVQYLCGLNYTDRQIGMIVQRKVDCRMEMSIPEAELNYPSFSIVLGASPQRYTRRVTNVGEANSSYDVEIGSPRGVKVVVEPGSLSFTGFQQELVYSVTFSRSSPVEEVAAFGEGFLEWQSDKRSVRSPIAVVFK